MVQYLVEICHGSMMFYQGSASLTDHIKELAPRTAAFWVLVQRAGVSPCPCRYFRRFFFHIFLCRFKYKVFCKSKASEKEYCFGVGMRTTSASLNPSILPVCWKSSEGYRVTFEGSVMNNLGIKFSKLYFRKSLLDAVSHDFQQDPSVR